MRVATFNSSSWTQLQYYLGKCDCDVVLVQEHHVLQSGVDHASQWVLRRGWKSLWNPAAPSASASGRGSVGGTAIMVRRQFGLALPVGQDGVLVPARASAGIISCPR